MYPRFGFFAFAVGIVLAALAFADAANAQSRTGVTFNPAAVEDLHLADGSVRLRIPITGSLQNPVWSPDGRTILFTRFRDGYNHGRADLFLFDLVANTVTSLVEDGHSNVSQPGSAWSARTNRIVFSSTRDGHHDEIYSVAPTPEDLKIQQLTSRKTIKSYEPSIAPDGRAVVFESHASGDERGRITIVRLDAPDTYVEITEAAEDAREPNWSPVGNLIVYQKRTDDLWQLWLYDVKSNTQRQLTTSDSDKTDATFSPDGRFVLYSGESDEDDSDSDVDADGDNLFALPVDGSGKPVAITRDSGYHGASSWSPDGTYVALESAPEAPNGSQGTTLMLTPVPKSLQPRR